MHTQGGGPIDYVVGYAGESAFGRSFQTLGDGGVLTFFGASSLSLFMGKAGARPAADVLARAGLRAGARFLSYTGPVPRTGSSILLRSKRWRSAAAWALVLPCWRIRSVNEFVTSWFGASFCGVVSVEEIGRRLGDDFDPPGPFMACRSFTASATGSGAHFSDRTLKPIGSAIAPLLRTPFDRRGLPDVIFERRSVTASALQRRSSSPTSALSAMPKT